MLTFVPHLGVKIETIRRWFLTVLKISGKFSLFYPFNSHKNDWKPLSPTLQF